MPKKWTDLALPLGIVLCILVIYMPLPTAVMDFLLAGNITLAIILLLAALFAKSPLELSAFPSLLLVTTLGRLALNVATTRLILTRGPEEQELAAGEVVRAFAQFVTGDHLLVGAIIFAILFVVQFVVITKGATRIGEVAARFALDGLPGRQMAIDADLNSGLIDLKEAQFRRRELLRHADFHGAMDGASKYVRGDAIAGLLITVINIVAGLILGVSSGMSLAESADVFTKLTIGDGLVTQLPALLISVAAGLLVSRGSDEVNLPRESVTQLVANPIVLTITAAFVGVLAFTSLPKLPLLFIATLTGGIAFFGSRRTQIQPERVTSKARGQGDAAPDRLLDLDTLEIQLGSDLIRLADSAQGGKLLAEIAAIRKQVAYSQGILLPKVRVRDNLNLPTSTFELLLQGNKIVRASMPPDRLLVPQPEGDIPGGLRAQGLPWATAGQWIKQSASETSPQLLNSCQVIARSLKWMSEVYSRDLLSRDAVQQMLDELKKTAPTVVAELIPGTMSLARLQKILQELVLGGVNLRPLAMICEAIADLGSAGLNDWQIVEEVRLRLGRQIAERLKGSMGNIRCFCVGEEVAIRMRSALSAQNGVDLNEQLRLLPQSLRANLLRAIESGQRHMLAMQLTPVLLVDQDLRPLIARICEPLRPDLTVIGTREVAEHATCERLAEIRWSDLQVEKAAA